MYDNKWQINVVVLHMQFLVLKHYVANDNRQKYKRTQKNFMLPTSCPSAHIFGMILKFYLLVLKGYS